MISIISSLYKTERHLKKFLENSKRIHKNLNKRGIIFEQILVINDASEVEKKMIEDSGLTLNKIYVARESIYASWNRGIKASSYKYCTFWGVDDVRFSCAIIAGIKTLEEGYYATYFPFIYKRYVSIFGKLILAKVKIFSPPNYDTELFKTGMFGGPHFIVNNEIFDVIGYFDEKFMIAGDFDLWVRLAKSEFRVKKTNRISGIFVNDGKTLSGSKSERIKEEVSLILNQ